MALRIAPPRVLGPYFRLLFGWHFEHRLKLSAESARIVDGVALPIVIEVGPHAGSAAAFDPFGPQGQFGFRIIMAIPPCHAVEAKIDFIGRPNEFIGKSGTAAGTEDDSAVAKSCINLVVPPAVVTKFYDIAPGWIKLAHDPPEPGRGIMKARGQLKKETTHALA